jgi:hypothetical protein
MTTRYDGLKFSGTDCNDIVPVGQGICGGLP